MKNVGGMLKLGVILMAYSAVACVGLAFVYSSTEKTIAERAVQDSIDAMKSIFPEATAFEAVDDVVFTGDKMKMLEAKAAKKDGELIGLIIKAQGPSYSGQTLVLVGVALPPSTTSKEINLQTSASGNELKEEVKNAVLAENEKATLNLTIKAVRILENKDTPGLGANAVSPVYYVNKEKKITFPGQFSGKLVSDAFEVRKDVEAITASTITSRSISNIVKASALAADTWLLKKMQGAE